MVNRLPPHVARAMARSNLPRSACLPTTPGYTPILVPSSVTRFRSHHHGSPEGGMGALWSLNAIWVVTTTFVAIAPIDFGDFRGRILNGGGYIP
jgi:hypothetical protein